MKAQRETGELPALFNGSLKSFSSMPLSRIIRNLGVMEGPVLEGQHRQTAERTARTLKRSVLKTLKTLEGGSQEVLWAHFGGGRYHGLRLEKNPQGTFKITLSPAHFPVICREKKTAAGTVIRGINRAFGRKPVTAYETPLEAVKRVIKNGFGAGLPNAVFTIPAHAIKERFAESPKGDRFFVQTLAPLSTIIQNGVGYPHETEPHDIVGVTIMLERGISDDARQERIRRYQEELKGKPLHFI